MFRRVILFAQKQKAQARNPYLKEDLRLAYWSRRDTKMMQKLRHCDRVRRLAFAPSRHSKLPAILVRLGRQVRCRNEFPASGDHIRAPLQSAAGKKTKLTDAEIHSPSLPKSVWPQH